MAVPRRPLTLAAILLATVATGLALAEGSSGEEVKTYLEPNIKDQDGTPAYVHVTPRDMPLRVEIGFPKESAKYASRKKTREVAIEAMRMWETALKPHVPWFELEFAEEDPEAAVQVEWKRDVRGAQG